LRGRGHAVCLLSTRSMGGRQCRRGREP